MCRRGVLYGKGRVKAPKLPQLATPNLGLHPHCTQNYIYRIPNNFFLPDSESYRCLLVDSSAHRVLPDSSPGECLRAMVSIFRHIRMVKRNWYVCFARANVVLNKFQVKQTLVVRCNCELFARTRAKFYFPRGTTHFRIDTRRELWSMACTRRLCWCTCFLCIAAHLHAMLAMTLSITMSCKVLTCQADQLLDKCLPPSLFYAMLPHRD